MCGIAGYIGINPPSESAIDQTLEVLAHRGPDGKGVYLDQGNPSVALLHRRLAILDLDPRSNQPYHSDDGVLIFNGEIYNYIELRKQLQALGHTFATSGDTEVLARAMRQWGRGAFDRFEGMWAMAWFDKRNRQLLLSRDRFGEKPLYLWEHDGGLYFASEVKALASLAQKRPHPNHNHLLRYMVNGYKALYKTTETYFEGVRELPLASTMVIEGDLKRETFKYWQPGLKEEHEASYEDFVERTRYAIIRSVELRMRADVPLAFCMSGGIDSNTLISTARKELDLDVHGFTIVNTDHRYEEQALIDHAVQSLDIQHTAVPLRQQGFLENMQRLVASHDGPVGTISYYVHWQLMQAVSDQGYKVTISGTAADELFTGYYDHHNLYLYEVANDPELHAKSLGYWKQYQSEIVRNPHLQKPDLYLKDPSFRDHVFLNNDLFASWMRKEWQEPFTETDFGVGLLRNRMLNELFAEAVPVILKEDDLNAMFFSLENRSPFLDRHLFDVAYSIPAKFLVKEGRAKSVLRDAMRGIVPDRILDERRKVGFNAPILDLVDVKSREVREFLLDDGPIFELVKKSSIEELLDQEYLPNSSSKFLFYFINSKMFLETQRQES